MAALDQVLTREQLRRVQEAVGGLPPELRRCLQLRLALDLKYSEIATILRVPVGTVKSRLGEAKSRLKAELNRAV
jgi:RNA polymerase sigma-70 factor (ECF subfamily)